MGLSVQLKRNWAVLRSRKISKEKAANKIDGIVALVMASLEAVRQGSEAPLILLRSDGVANLLHNVGRGGDCSSW